MHSSEGYEKALTLITQAGSPKGFLASPREKDNYRRIWTRDGVITGLAALLTGNDALRGIFRQTLTTVFDNQHPLGLIPSSVTSEGKASYGGTVGRADNPSWAVIGLCVYANRTGDKVLAGKYEHAVEKCLHVLDIWEYNGKHLVYVPQSGDWADEYMYHGYNLYDQLLRIWALRLASELYCRNEWSEKARMIMTTVRSNYWNGEPENRYSTNLLHQLSTAPTRYWFMGFNPARIYSQFDLPGNALALLLDLGDPEQNSAVLSFVEELANDFKSVLPAFHPVIGTTDPLMTELSNNFAYGFRNKPGQFHNGGLWPVWNGFMVAALTRHGANGLAMRLTNAIHQANETDDWSFNECLDGSTKIPVGIPFCTWSAAGAIIAEYAMKGNSIV